MHEQLSLKKYGMMYMVVKRVDNLVMGEELNQCMEEEEETSFGVEPLTIPG